MPPSEPDADGIPEQSSATNDGSIFSLDEICDRFEDVWLQGAPPRVEDFVLQSTETERLETLRELLRVDLHYRRKKRNAPTIAEYEARFPDLDYAWLEQLFAPPVSPDATLKRGLVGERQDARHDEGAGKTVQASGLPKILGYEVLEEIGRGGMGVVYRARQLGLNRLVAIKMVLMGDYAGTELLERFRTEAQTVGRLQHPNLVQIYEVGAVDGRPFLSFEFIRGGSLAQRLAGQSQPSRPAAVLMWTLANAVQFAHTRGVIHRDLKPANILLDADMNSRPTLGGVKSGSPVTPTDPPKRITEGMASFGETSSNTGQKQRRVSPLSMSTTELRSDHSKRNRDADRRLIVETYGIPKISDFGLAKQLEEGAAQTQTGAILGTPSYMSPEQAAGQSQNIGPGTDVYSLGAILYEMLTGRPPFRAPTVMETLDQVRTRDPLSLRSIEPAVPRDLETICLKCLQKDPIRRYLSAGELAGDLDRYLRDIPVLARPISTTERTIRWCRRRPLAATLLVLLVFVTVTGFSGVLYQWRQSELLRELAEDNADSARRQKENAETQHALALNNFQKAEQNRQRAEAAREQGERVICLQNVSSANQALQSQDAMLANELLDKCRPDLRDWEWYYLQRQCQRGVKIFRGHTDVTTAAAFSPDGMRMATVSGLWGTLKPGELILWDLMNRTMLEKRIDPSGPFFGVAFHQQRPILATTGVAWGGSKTPKLWNLEDLQEIAKISEGGNAFAMAMSLDGQWLGLGGANGQVHLCDAMTGQIVHTFVGHSDNIFGIAFSPDSRLIASGSRDHSVRIWDTSTRSLVHFFQNLGDIRGIAFSADGELLAAINYLGLVMLWDTQDWSEFAIHHARAFPGSSIRFTPDGQSLAIAAGDKLQIWDPATGEVRKNLSGHWRDTFIGAFSPDGRSLATCGTDRLIRVIDLTTEPDGQAVRLENQTMFADVDVSQDGRWVALAANRDVPPIDPNRHFLMIRSIDDDRDARRIYGHSDRLTSVAFAPDGTQVASGSYDRTIRICDIATGQKLRTLAAHDGAVMSVAYSPDGSMLASASADRTLKIWNHRTGEVQRTLVGHMNPVTRVVFTHDGNSLISAAEDGQIRYWPLQSADAAFELSGHSGAVRALAVSHDQRWLASAGLDQQILVWDLKVVEKDRSALRPSMILQGQFESVSGLDFSPDSRRLVSASENRGPTLWDLATGQAAFTLLPNPGGLPRVRFTPDGHRIVMVARLDLSVWDNRLPDEPSSDERTRIASRWHRREANSPDRRGLPFAVLHHLRQIPDSQFDDELRQLRARANARLGNWSAATADFESLAIGNSTDARASAANSEHPVLKDGANDFPLMQRLYDMAMVRRLCNDEAGYRQWCRRLIDGFVTTSNPDVGNNVAWACSVGLNERSDLESIVQMVQEKLSKATQKAQRNELLNTMGALLYRTGRFDEAISKLNESIAENGNGGIFEDWIFLSMANARVGREDQAHRWLEQCRSSLEKSRQDSKARQRRRTATDWDTIPVQKHLFREAEALVKPIQ